MARKLASQKARECAFIDLECAGSLGLGEPPCTNPLRNTNRKSGLGETLLRIAQTEIGEDVSAAFLDRNPIVHDPLAPLGGVTATWPRCESTRQASGWGNTRNVLPQPFGMLFERKADSPTSESL